VGNSTACLLRIVDPDDPDDVVNDNVTEQTPGYELATESIQSHTFAPISNTITCLYGTRACTDNSKCIVLEHMCDGGIP